MISKHLAIAAAIVFLSAASVGQALAQTAPAQPAMASPGAAAPAMTGAPASGTPGATMSGPGTAVAPAATPAAAPAVTPPEAAAPAAPKESPYGLVPLWKNGDFVIRAVIVLLGIMSAGTWYIFITKYLEQARVLGQAKTVERRFWSSNNLNEGIDKLPKSSVFRSVAESGVRAAAGQGTGLVNLNDWIGMSLNRQLDEANAQLQNGIAFLASVGSTSPFIGLFGTVWGILNALIAIGIAGQASIDKVAGPVGTALIATALGLLVAVPAVLLYNYVVRRNKVINEKLRSFASDLQTYLVTNKK
jgi:biopolymer transport protein ExbB